MKKFAITFLLTSFILFGCNSVPPSKSYTAYGVVRSVMTEYHFPQSNFTVIAFETDDGQILKIKFNSIEPQLWPGLHAKIVYATTPDTESRGGYEQGMYKLLSVERLSPTQNPKTQN